MEEEKKKKKMDKTTLLSILLLLSVAYIANDWYTEKQMAKLEAEQAEQMGIFQQGAAFGYEQAVVQLAQQAVTCQPVPVSVDNVTINMIAVECLQAMAEAQAQAQ